MVIRLLNRQGARPTRAAPARGMPTMHRLSWLMLLLLVVAASCAGSESATAPPTEPAMEEPTGEPTGQAATEHSTEGGAEPGSAEPTTAASGPGEVTGDAGLEGEDTEGPTPGTTFAVVGVAADDTLNVRHVPGTAGHVVDQLEPLTEDIRATGRGRLVDESLWYEIQTDAVDAGWVNARYLAVLGETTDITSELADRPAAETMLQLADVVAELRLPTEVEGEGPSVVVSDGPSVGDLGEVTVDLLGFPDDAIRGERLRVFAEPAVAGEGFRLRTVERTLLCARGVSDGLCL